MDHDDGLAIRFMIYHPKEGY